MFAQCGVPDVLISDNGARQRSLPHLPSSGILSMSRPHPIIQSEMVRLGML